MTKRATFTEPCPSCRGLGKIFKCAEWDRTHGNCCPAGAVRTNCPGKSMPCPDCGGKGSIESKTQ